MKKKLYAILLVFVLLLGAAPLSAMAATPYADIDGAWYTDAAGQYGYPDIFDDGSGNFRPDADITRMEFVRLLHKALGITINYFAAPDIADRFDDMKNTDAGATELIDLVTAGIVKSGGSFRPGDSLDREIMIHWIVRALDYMTGGNYAVIKMMPPPFDDDGSIDPALKNDVITARLTNLINGRGDNLLFPKDGATRAEAVTVAARLVALLEALKGRVEVVPTAAVVNNMLEMKLTVINGTDETVTIRHTSGQRFDFKLFDAKGENVYTWSADKMFIMALGTTELKPGQSVTFSDTLDLDGAPTLNAAVTMTAYLAGASDDFAIDENGYATNIVK